jgi:hypothetical protein
MGIQLPQVDQREAGDAILPFPGPGEARDAVGRDAPVESAQPLAKCGVEHGGVRHADETGTVGVRGDEAVDGEEVQHQIFARHDRVAVRAALAVGGAKTEYLGEADDLIDRGAREERSRRLTGHRPTASNFSDAGSTLVPNTDCP